MKPTLRKPDWKELTFPDVLTHSSYLKDSHLWIVIDLGDYIVRKKFPMVQIELDEPQRVSIEVNSKVPIIVDSDVRACYQLRTLADEPITSWTRCGYIDLYKGKEPLRKILKTKIQGTVTHVRKTLGMGN